jgi:hypothetical protein
VTSSSCPWQQKEKKNIARSLCNFLLLSLAAKGKKNTPVPCVTSSSYPWQQKEKKTLPVPCVTFSSCPWQQKEKKNITRSLCNFLLLCPMAAKGKFETGQGRCRGRAR